MTTHMYDREVRGDLRGLEEHIRAADSAQCSYQRFHSVHDAISSFGVAQLFLISSDDADLLWDIKSRGLRRHALFDAAKDFVKAYKETHPKKFRKDGRGPLTPTVKNKDFEAHFRPACDELEDVYRDIKAWLPTVRLEPIDTTNLVPSGVLFYHGTKILPDHVDREISVREFAAKMAARADVCRNTH